MDNLSTLEALLFIFVHISQFLQPVPKICEFLTAEFKGGFKSGQRFILSPLLLP